MTIRKTSGLRHMTPAERDDCVRLYRDGATIDQLAEQFDRDHRTVARLVARRRAWRTSRSGVINVASPHSRVDSPYSNG
jgi:IS30 family transposase